MALCFSTYFLECIPGRDISEANLQYHSAVNAKFLSVLTLRTQPQRKSK